MALLLVLQKEIVNVYPHKTITAWFYSIGTVLSAIAAAAAVPNTGELNVRAGVIWIALGYASFFATMFNYCAMTWTNKHLSASVVSAFMTLQPVATVVLSSLFLSYDVQVAQIVSGIIVIGGLLATCYGQYLDHLSQAETRGDMNTAHSYTEVKQDGEECNDSLSFYTSEHGTGIPPKYPVRKNSINADQPSVNDGNNFQQCGNEQD